MEFHALFFIMIFHVFAYLVLLPLEVMMMGCQGREKVPPAMWKQVMGNTTGRYEMFRGLLKSDVPVK